MIAVRKLAPLVALAAIVFGVAGVAAGLYDPAPGLDPLHVSVGEYAMAERGGVTATALAIMALGALVLLVGMRAAGAPVRGTPGRLMAVWPGAVLLTVAVPATPFGADPVVAAYAHRFAAAVAFVSLPVAAALLAPRLAGDAAWKPLARTVEWLALAGGLGLLAVTYVALPGERVMIGLVERLLLGAEAALLVVLAGGLLRVVWGRSSVKLRTYHRFIAS